jgi:hypothetical protein
LILNMFEGVVVVRIVLDVVLSSKFEFTVVVSHIVCYIYTS